MELISFQVKNFRSINDSGPIKVSRITALLGRNESGKSNLLLALRSLNPAEGYGDLNPIKDFPRHRRLEECLPTTEVVETKWLMTPADRLELAKILPRAGSLTHVNIGRRYKGQRWVGFVGLTSIPAQSTDVIAKVRRIAPAVKAATVDSDKMAALHTAADAFEKQALPFPDSITWARATVPAIAALRVALAAADAELSDKQETTLNEVDDLAKTIVADVQAQQAARTWAVEQLPIFMFLDDYPALSGHQDIGKYLARKEADSLTSADRDFEKLCKVAGLDAETLQTLMAQDAHETRNQLANRASSVVTKEIRRLWKDRPLKVRFNLDASHLDTFISDPNATYDVEVNLDERSRGFKWFFSFYISFSADTRGGIAEKAILLLDEPGLYLHAKSQTDLLTHFEKDFNNYILYTTHSPYMVPTNNLDAIRTVNIGEDTGTTVSNDPTGDSWTLFPLQAALGYNLAQSLFVGPNNLVVEGVTDFWILSSISTYLADSGKKGLSSALTLTPAGGAQKVSYMVALLSSEKLNVLVLLDDEKASRETATELVRQKLIRENNVVFVSEALKPAPKEADIEDLLEPATYEQLVSESYAKELKGKPLVLNANIPRIAKRVELALKERGIEFHKTRPSRLLLEKMASEPSDIVSSDVAKRFEKLFALINERFKKHTDSDPKPFR